MWGLLSRFMYLGLFLKYILPWTHAHWYYIKKMVTSNRTHLLCSTGNSDKAFICNLILLWPIHLCYTLYKRQGRKVRKLATTTTKAVMSRSTHLSQSFRQWRLWGNWGCRSASPAELLCSSCSSQTVPLQNRQRIKPPETSGRRRHKTKNKNRNLLLSTETQRWQQTEKRK